MVNYFFMKLWLLALVLSFTRSLKVKLSFPQIHRSLLWLKILIYVNVMIFVRSGGYPKSPRTQYKLISSYHSLLGISAKALTKRRQFLLARPMNLFQQYNRFEKHKCSRTSAINEAYAAY